MRSGLACLSGRLKRVHKTSISRVFFGVIHRRHWKRAGREDKKKKKIMNGFNIIYIIGSPRRKGHPSGGSSQAACTGVVVFSQWQIRVCPR
jgi:hypothetical protein